MIFSRISKRFIKKNNGFYKLSFTQKSSFSIIIRIRIEYMVCSKFILKCLQVFFFKVKLDNYSIVRTFVTPPPPLFRRQTLENPLNSDFKRKNPEKKSFYVLFRDFARFSVGKGV